jgi:peptide/nickel transport system ATP-binding protein
MPESSPTILSIRNLSVHYPVKNEKGKRCLLKAIDGVDLDVLRGEVLGIIGESGSGKSTLAYSVVGLQRPTTGNIRFQGEELESSRKRRPMRNKRGIQIIFQDSGTSLNPAHTVRKILELPLKVHKMIDRASISDRIDELLHDIELPISYRNKKPAAMGGGQRQRVSIARALAVNPQLLILDEPTSSLDVSVQAKVINMLLRLRKEHELTYVFITHDLSLMRNIADRIAIMYLGRIMELGPTEDFFSNPRHPYTRMLLSSIPVVSAEDEALRTDDAPIVGETPSPVDLSPGCAFCSRCPLCDELCRHEVPELYEYLPGRFVRCHVARRTVEQTRRTERAYRTPMDSSLL